MTGFLKQAFAWIAVSESVGMAGAIFTSKSIPGWYATLNRPSFSPPNWIFGPVWTALYACMGIAMALVMSTPGAARKRTATVLFVVQLVLNFAWSVIFFGYRKPLWAFIEIIVLLVAIIITTVLFFTINKKAGLLMIPYVLWTSFATVLNGSIAARN